MVPVVPSPAVLNARLTSEKVALEARLQESNKAVRDLRQKNAKLVDLVSQLEDTQRELRDHLRRWLGKHGAPKLAEGQGLLFADSLEGLTSAIEGLAAPDSETEELALLDAADAEVPDAESASDPEPKSRRSRDRRKIDQPSLTASDVGRAIHMA